MPGPSPHIPPRATGCALADCHLCRNNPSRKCEANIRAMLCENDPLKAKCGAELRAELLDANGELASKDPSLKLQVCRGKGGGGSPGWVHAAAACCQCRSVLVLLS